MRILLDTHALVIWCSNPALVADISLWEIAVLTRSGRLRLDLPLREWLTRAVAVI